MLVQPVALATYIRSAEELAEQANVGGFAAPRARPEGNSNMGRSNCTFLVESKLEGGFGGILGQIEEEGPVLAPLDREWATVAPC
jgi:hypothetical protein